MCHCDEKSNQVMENIAVDRVVFCFVIVHL